MSKQLVYESESNESIMFIVSQSLNYKGVLFILTTLSLLIDLVY